jgi:hypothetical protein
LDELLEYHTLVLKNIIKYDLERWSVKNYNAESKIESRLGFLLVYNGKCR